LRVAGDSSRTVLPLDEVDAGENVLAREVEIVEATCVEVHGTPR
jgi:hypothetical protein